jgi:CDP-glucose 4,6-dehydratase
MIFSAYLESYFKARLEFGIASVRAGNVIGGGDWSEGRIVPDVIRALSSNVEIQLRFPHSTRPWQHVLEPLSGYLTLAMKLFEDGHEFSGSWNFGPSGESIMTVSDLVESIIKRWGGGRVSDEITQSPRNEAGLLHLNCDKALRKLRWSTKWDFNETIAATVDWYRAVLGGGNVREITGGQIEKYLNFGSAK